MKGNMKRRGWKMEEMGEWKLEMEGKEKRKGKRKGRYRKR